MFKVSRILCKIAQIFSIICSVTVWFSFGAVLIEISLSTGMGDLGEVLINLFNEIGAEEAADVVAGMSVAIIILAMILCVCIFICYTILFIVNAVLSAKASNRHSKKLYIANIVFGFLTGIELNAAGGIVGLIALKREGNRERRQLLEDDIPQEPEEEMLLIEEAPVEEEAPAEEPAPIIEPEPIKEPEPIVEPELDEREPEPLKKEEAPDVVEVPAEGQPEEVVSDGEVKGD